jgi:hypothetical protein
MKWFNRHLNIAYGIILAISFVLSMVGLFFILRDLKNFNAAWLAIIFVCSFLPFFAAIWVLYQKGQSMWWLAIFLVFSVALYVLTLVLPNKRTAQSEAQKISDTAYYQQREGENK